MENVLLADSNVYHVFNRSIAGFKIFNYDSEYFRFQRIIKYYQVENPGLSFSKHIPREERKYEVHQKIQGNVVFDNESIVSIIAYCAMPTHIHLILRQEKERGVSIFMNNILNSYTRYFNTKYKRKGPLWEGRFKRVLVGTDEQLWHLTRYIHLNPVTAYLVNKPHEWHCSSYNEYLYKVSEKERICNFKELLEIEPVFYGEFVERNIDYQRSLAKLKNLALEESATA